MPEPHLTRLAEIDLLDIWEYIALDDEAAADRFLDRVEQVALMLLDNPTAGRLRTELGPEIRSLPIGCYVLFYRPEESGIIVLRVLHGARDILDLL